MDTKLYTADEKYAFVFILMANRAIADATKLCAMKKDCSGYLGDAVYLLIAASNALGYDIDSLVNDSKNQDVHAKQAQGNVTMKKIDYDLDDEHIGPEQINNIKRELSRRKSDNHVYKKHSWKDKRDANKDKYKKKFTY